MRIVQLIQRPQARGAEIFTCQLSSELENLGHQVLLISLFAGDFDLPFLGKQIHLGLSEKNRLWDFFSWRKLGDLIKDFDPDIVQSNGADTLKFSVFARMIVPGDYRLIFNNGGVVSYYIDSKLKKKFNQFLFREVDALISVSNYSKKDLDSFISKPKRHQVIPIGIDPQLLEKCVEESKDHILVNIAGFTLEKNHLDLLHIFEEFLVSKPDSQLWLIGDGPEKENIEIKVKAFSFSSKVKFFGSISNPFSIIPQNSFLVLPSKIEGLPAVILEAFKNKIPVFAYDVGGVPDIVNHRETGMLIPAEDQNAFVQSILDYISFSKEEKEIMLQNAYNLVSNSYQIPQVALEFEKFYRSL